MTLHMQHCSQHQSQQGMQNCHLLTDYILYTLGAAGVSNHLLTIESVRPNRAPTLWCPTSRFRDEPGVRHQIRGGFFVPENPLVFYPIQMFRRFLMALTSLVSGGSVHEW